MRQLTIFEDPSESSFKNFTIYRSSAGSGKTFTLVKEYLKIVLRNPLDYQHILAITFTNKATEEMKFRILKDLREMAAGKPSDMRAVIEKEFAHFPQKLNITDRASKALNNILHNYSRFAISTIDHFFSQLVRALARELRLNLNYEIDVDDETAMRESLQKLYEKLHENPELRDWVKDFAFNRIDQDKGWQLDYNLVEFGMELFKEKFHQGFSKIDPQLVNLKSLRELEQQLQNTMVNYRNQQKEKAREALALIKRHGLTVDDFKFRGSGAAGVFQHILRGRLGLNKRFLDVACGHDDWYTQKSLKIQEIKAAAMDGLDLLAAEIFQFHQKHYAEYVTASQLQRHIYSYGLLDALNEQLKAYRQENNLMLLSHNSFLLKEVIDNREAPFLFEKLGSYYHHVLIDEFQDTSGYQWDNLKPLVAHALDNQNHVLLVGDAKQSIYRWRGGDLNLLLNKAQGDLSNYRQQLQQETLQTNRRSARSVVEFNNTFFRLASTALLGTEGLPEDPKMLADVYREVKQEQHEKRQGGVQVRFFERDDNNWWEQSSQAILDLVQEHRASGGRYKDFLVLLSKNEEVTQISEWLSAHQIPAISDQALRLSGNWAVRLVISAMYLLMDNDDPLARAEMAYLYQKGINNQALDYNGLFQEALRCPTGLLESYLPPELCRQWSLIQHMSMFEWVAEVIPLLMPKEGPNPFLERFMEICLEQAKKGLHSAYDFLDWWEKNKNSQMVISPSHQDALRIMTIHKAKGLEAPIVVVPRADFELKPRKDTIFWTDRLPPQYDRFKLLPLSFSSDLLQSHFAEAFRRELMEGLIEGLNVAYVAFTRARDRLHVFTVKSSKPPGPEDLGSLYKLLWHVCTDPAWGASWDLQKSMFTMGDLRAAIGSEESKAKPSLELKELKLSPYRSKVQIRSEAHKFFLLLDHQKTQKLKEGIKLHAVLEQMKNVQSLPLVMDRLQTQGILQTEDRPGLENKIKILFEQPLFKSWFDPSWEVLTEREIISGGQRYLPDRVIIKKEQAVVIDYKREKLDPKHRQQVSGYARLLQQMGYSEIKKYLVYVDDLKIITVDE